LFVIVIINNKQLSYIAIC